jgi:hypothetical protein
MELQMNPEAPAPEIARLCLELPHVSGQAVMAHNMAIDWRQRCLGSHALYRRLQQPIDRLRKKIESLRQKKGVVVATDDEDGRDETLQGSTLPESISTTAAELLFLFVGLRPPDAERN